MMAFGLQVVNSAGLYQIDEVYRNLLKVAEGSGVNGLNTLTLPKQTTTPPLVFVLPASDTVYVGNYASYNDATSTKIILESNGTFQYVVYGLDSPAVMDSSTFGLSVYTSAGQLAYDSRYEAVRLQTVWTFTQPVPDPYDGGAATAYPYTLSFTSWGARPWILMNTMLFLNDANGAGLVASTSGTSAIVVRCGYKVSGNWVWSRNSTSDPGTNDLADGSPSGQVMAAIARRFN